MPDSRRHSEDTVIPDNESVFTSLSDDTLADLSSQVFGLPLPSFSTIREFSIASSFLHPGVSVFRSIDDARKGSSPMLCTQSSVFSVFKKNAPFMVICAYDDAGHSYEYCRVHFKNVANNLSCYILMFPHTSVVVLNNGLRPAADVSYCDTKLRVLGSSGDNSTFASGELKMYVLQPNALSLTDGASLVQPTPGSIKGAKVGFSASANGLCQALSESKKHLHAKLLSECRTLANIPLVTYTDTGDKKIAGSKHSLNGTVRMFHPPGDDSEHSMVMLCVMLVLREQEMRKSKGGKRPTYVEH
ncbi:hypothetical protein JA9_004574 [Meyerozyma sp. JA9]|nr:hypothetical protein JA9_004574 [Meyerozyma sp. JA9]